MASVRSGRPEAVGQRQWVENPPPADATGPEGYRGRRGAVARAVAWLDENQSAFVVARLIMMTGLKLRSFTPLSPDESPVLHKLDSAIRAVLTADDHQLVHRIMYEEKRP